jgi:D-cysteine desulfhydrase
MSGLQARLIGVNVCDNRDYFVRTIAGICAEFAAHFPGAPSVVPGEIEILDGFVGLGYARSRPEELSTLRDLARREGLILDPVYTGKAFHALICELERDRGVFGERVVFLHTGGIFGLFPLAEQFAETK